MTLEAAAIQLIAALRLRAESWVPCEATPGELAREWGGPPPALAGRVMRGWLTGSMVREAMERRGVAVQYDRRRRCFALRSA